MKYPLTIPTQYVITIIIQGRQKLEKQINWTLGSGKQATYTIELVLERRINGDISIVPCCEIETHMSIPGNGCIPSNLDTDSGIYQGFAYAAKIGGKVLISQAVYDEIMAARAEVESHPAWIAKLDTIKRNKREIAAYEAKQKANGLCPKCGTYCDGDCDAN